MPATAWDPLVARLTTDQDGIRCELRDGRTVTFGLEWRGRVSVTDRVYVAADVSIVDRSTALHLERNGRSDFAQIPITAAAPPRKNHRGAFVMLDAAGAQNGISKVLVTAGQIRDYFFGPERGVEWSKQPSWFEVLGVRESSNAAEIRLGYRIRMLEIRANGSEASRTQQAQLARGLQILLDPDLHRSYLCLLEDPDSNVPFPPWTVGRLRATGQRRGDLFVVQELLNFFPQAERRTLRLALRRFRFEGAQAVYRDVRRRIVIRFDSTLLPMQWSDEWNTWAHLALGSTTVGAVFWQQTRYKRTGGKFVPTVWSQPFQSTLSVPNQTAIEPRFQAARLFWEHFQPYAEMVALLRARIEQTPMEIQEAIEWCRLHGVHQIGEGRWINWEPDYEEVYYRELAVRANAVYLFRNEYLFVFGHTVVSEIPQSGHASYVFHPPASLSAFLLSYARTTRHVIRIDAAGAKRTLGYTGRIPHLKDFRIWIQNIERTIERPATQRATA